MKFFVAIFAISFVIGAGVRVLQSWEHDKSFKQQCLWSLNDC